MANADHLSILKEGVPAWNQWRDKFPDIVPDLSWANLQVRELNGVDFSRGYLREAKLDGAILSGATLWKADLYRAQFTEADLSHANLRKANLFEANLTRAQLRNTNLTGTLLVDADLSGAVVTDCLVYGTSAWGLRVNEETSQANLVIRDAPGNRTWIPSAEGLAITVDNLEMAQFIFLLLSNRHIGSVIDTITSKVVLILGRFTAERKAVLDALRDELRHRDRLPVLFDFAPATSQSRMETVSTLAHLARFVIADITDAKTVLQELQGIVPVRPMLPVQPILLTGQKEPGMFDFFTGLDWFLPTVYYDTPELLLTSLEERVIGPAEAKAEQLARRLQERRKNG